MAAYEKLLVDLLTLIYHISWLVFLTRKHYGQVTTTAEHIFELNVLLNYIINNLLWIILVDLEALLLDDVTAEILETAMLYSFEVAIVCSQIETAVFLKTMNVNTMMTNIALKIILTLTIVSYGLGAFITLALPSTRVIHREIWACQYLNKRDFYCITIPHTVCFVVVPSAVMVFSVFRGLRIRRISDNLNLDTPSQGRLFIIQEVISKINQEAPRETIEEDIVIQDIELVNMDNSASTGQLQEINDINSLTRNQQNRIGCVPLPGINMIMKTMQKYMKNTIISFLILTSQLPWFSTAWYGFITSSGCEDPTIKEMAGLGDYGWYLLTILMPLLIKLKLDRLIA